MKPPLFISVLVLLCFFQSNIAQNQKKIDSLLEVYSSQKEDTLKVNTITHLYNAYLYNDQERAKKYALEQLKLSKKINFEKGIAKSLYHIGVYFNNITKFDSAMVYYKRSLKKYIKIKDIDGQTTLNHGIAIINAAQGKYDTALELLDTNINIYSTKPIDSISLAISYDLKGGINSYLGNYQIALTQALKSLDILEKIDAPIRKADALNKLASIEFYLGNYEKANEYNLQALPIYKEKNDKYYECQTLNDIGNTYYYLNDYNNSERYLKKSISLSREVKSKAIEATALGNLGKTYTKLGRFYEAIKLINESLKMVEKANNIAKISESLNSLGMAYNAKNEPKQAIKYFDRAEVIADSIGKKQSLRIAYFNRSQSYQKLKFYKIALEDYKSFKSVSDSIFNTTKSQQIEELRTIYETEKKEQQIVLQENEIELLEQKDKVSNLQKSLLGGGLLLSLGLIGVGFYGFRQKIKRNKLEKDKVDSELAFKRKELTTHALHLAKKNEVLESLKQKAEELKKSETSQNGYQQLIRTINFDLKDDNNWENFSKYFQEVHKDFNGNVKQKFPEVTSNELRLMSLLKMNLSSKEIANILNISQEGIKKARYRLRKKLDISTEESLQDLVLSL